MLIEDAHTTVSVKTVVMNATWKTVATAIRGEEDCAKKEEERNRKRDSAAQCRVSFHRVVNHVTNRPVRTAKEALL